MELNITLWSSLFEIFIINLILSGDNAVVIALATLHLDEKNRRKGIFWGTFGAVTLRIILTAGAVLLLSLSYIQAIGAVLLLWIAIRLLKGEESTGDNKFQKADNLRQVIQTIIIADLLMSLDNVLAVAGAAGGNILLLIVGLAISIPIVVFGSSFLSSLMRKWPWIISAGSGLLGYTAGEMILNDQSCLFLTEIKLLEQGLPWLLAFGVIITGNLLRNAKKHSVREDSVHHYQFIGKGEDILQESFVQVFSAGKPPKC